VSILLSSQPKLSHTSCYPLFQTFKEISFR
jgi:hypothetical protein